jgi:DNA-binding response OmpR family regulator
MDVALIKWPSDESLRLDLAEQGHPRLLLVEPEADPPECTDILEDWVRLPVSRQDRNARIRTLESRVGESRAPVPTIDDHGMLEYRDLRTQLSPIQTELVKPMIDRFGAVVPRDRLIAAGWPEGETTANTLDVTMGRLRRQLFNVGLKIRTVRSRGYLLTDAPRR